MSAVQPIKPATTATLETSSPAPAVKAPLTAAEVARKVRHERARKLFIALALWVGLPTLLGVIYYGGLARSQYESVATIVMRGSDAQTAQRAVMLREHILSRDIERRLDAEVELFTHYKTGGDLLSRLRPRAGTEARHAYYLNHVIPRYDIASHVFTLSVTAFSGKAAQQFTNAILASGAEFLARVEGSQEPMFVVVAQPSAPSDSTYPRRGYGILTVFLASFALFGIGSLLLASIREHAQF